MRRRLLSCLLFLSGSLLACGDDTASGGGGGAGVGGAGGVGGAVGGGPSDCVAHTTSAEPDFSVAPGRFALRSQDGFATLDGAVLSGPPVSFHVEAERQGACRLLTFSPSTCTPACDPGAFCVDTQCLTSPTALDAGALTLSDFQATPIAVASSGGAYFWTPNAVTDPGDHATLAGDGGGEVDPFSLSVCVPTAIVPEEDWSAQMTARAAGEDVVLRWSNVLAGARVYARMTTGIGTHGGISPVEVECEGPDVGELTLPGAYLDALFADGWGCGECGDNQLKRYVAAETELATGNVRFRAEAWTGFYFHP